LSGTEREITTLKISHVSFKATEAIKANRKAQSNQASKWLLGKFHFLPMRADIFINKRIMKYNKAHHLQKLIIPV